MQELEKEKKMSEPMILPCGQHYGAIMRLENFYRALDIADNCSDCSVE